MAWDEWEQLKTAAGERHTTQTRLNQLPADQGGTSSGGSGGGAGDLRSDKAAWTKAGEGVGSLRGNITKALTELEDGQKGLGKDSGCLTAVTQQDVYDSWKRYVKAVGERCGALAAVLTKAGNDQLKTDEAIEAEIARLKSGYQDTPAVDCQSKGR
ncbi:hypothetical protein [Streptomyces sp. NPDC088554]|uniref:hypothetical protein n=1 Tax=Streptomyces sp. NPDC088554 TaxID=3365865 RepID=UPI0037F5AD58